MNDNMDIPDWYEDLPKKADRLKGKGYKRMHETANGRSLPIAAMDNKHLENFINLMIEKMMSIKSQALYEVGESGDLFHMELNGVQKMDKKTAIKIISEIMYKLEPYLAELVIRGNNAYITIVSEKFESILGRSKINETGKNLLS